MPSDAAYENIELEELLIQLRETEVLEDKGDILHYLVCLQKIYYSLFDN